MAEGSGGLPALPGLSQRTWPSLHPSSALYLQNTGRTEAWKVLSPQGGSWDSVARILPNGSLLLPSVGIQDEGTFRCRTTNRNGKETKSNYRVRVYRKGPRALVLQPQLLALWFVRSSDLALPHSHPPAGHMRTLKATASEGTFPSRRDSWEARNHGSCL